MIIISLRDNSSFRISHLLASFRHSIHLLSLPFRIRIRLRFIFLIRFLELLIDIRLLYFFHFFVLFFCLFLLLSQAFEEFVSELGRESRGCFVFVELFYCLQGFSENVAVEETGLSYAVREQHQTYAMLDSVVPHSFVDRAVCPVHLSVALSLVIFVVSFVLVS